MKLELTVKGLSDLLKEVHTLRILYQRHLHALGVYANVEDGGEEGEIYVPFASERDKFVTEVNTNEIEQEEERLIHDELLRKLERDALRILEPSGFIPGIGPEGAEDPENSFEGNENPGEGPPPRVEG